MEPIYVTGHRNPDTDSIVAAISYAALRNSLGDREFSAARLGHISDETSRILERFDFQPPELLTTMRTQVKDLDYDQPPALNKGVTISRAWEALQANKNIPAIPITDEMGHLFGMVSAAEIASFDMELITNPIVEEVPVFNLLSVLEGQILNENSSLVNTVSGDVIIALPQAQENLLFQTANSIVICGNQPEMARRAIEMNVSCLIVCQAELPEELRRIPTTTCIISTPFDAVRTARFIYHAIPVDRICRRDDLECFHLDDFLDDVREVVSKSRSRNYPILDADDKVVGTLSRFHLIRPRRKRVVLVDHNEAAQSVPGLAQAEILEIIDHHRLADIQTTNPIYVRNEVVGSTSTIIASMYQEKGLMPSPNLAGLLAAAILSDTVMFKSPTATNRDRRMADRMARIAGVQLEELGQFIFAENSNMSKPAEELILTDFKEFHIAEHNLGVSQITCVESEKLLSRREEFLTVMKQIATKRGYSILILMLTDVLTNGSHLLYLGDEDIFRHAFNTELKDHACFLPGVVSRKKQVIPMLTALWG